MGEKSEGVIVTEKPRSTIDGTDGMEREFLFMRVIVGCGLL